MSKRPGRPPKPGGRSVRVSIRVPPSLLRELDDEAERVKVTRSAVVLAAIRRFLRF